MGRISGHSAVKEYQMGFRKHGSHPDPETEKQGNYTTDPNIFFQILRLPVDIYILLHFILKFSYTKMQLSHFMNKKMDTQQVE